jgi:O-antigen/teichoic acid export membrane protein
MSPRLDDAAAVAAHADEQGLVDSRALAGGSAYLFGAQLVGNTGFFVAVLVLARALEPAGRGTVAFLIVTAMVAARASGIGVREAVVVYAARRPAERPTLLSNLVVAAFATGTIAAGLVCGGLTLLGGLRPAGIGVGELVALGLGIAIAAQVDGGYYFLTGCSRFREQALVTASSSWMYAGSLVVLWATVGLTIRSAFWAWVAGQAGRALLLLWGATRGTRFGRPDLPLLRAMVSFGAPAWLGSVARFMNFRADQILMGFIATEASLGIYAVAVNASEILLYLPEATAIALLPIVARTEDTGRTDQALRAFRLLTVITLVSVVGAILIGWPLLPRVFGEQFAASTRPFLLLLPGAFGYVAMSVFSNVLLAYAPGLSSAGPAASLLVGLALDVALIPPFGASGAAAAASAAFLAGGVTAVLALRRRVPFGWAELIPRRGDLETLRRAARRLRAGRDASVVVKSPASDHTNMV